MELPAEVLIHNEILGLKGGKGDLIRISSEGFYELNLEFGERVHRVLLPIPTTVLINREPEEAGEPGFEVER